MTSYCDELHNVCFFFYTKSEATRAVLKKSKVLTNPDNFVTSTFL